MLIYNAQSLWFHPHYHIKPACCCRPIILALERVAGRSEIQGHPLLHNELEASQGYMSPYLKNKSMDGWMGRWIGGQSGGLDGQDQSSH